MSYETIIFEVEENIAIIRFNRPKVLNAINRTVVAEMKDAVEKVAADKSIKILILTGSGDKAFVSGADIAFMRDFTPLQGRSFSDDGKEVLFQLEALSIPVIACVNGFALGGGLELAMACDFIYAADSAKLGQPEINLGIIPGFGGTQRLARLVGKAMAKELCMTGAIITAMEAKDIKRQGFSQGSQRFNRKGLRSGSQDWLLHGVRCICYLPDQRGCQRGNGGLPGKEKS
jgi:enoyl-CoA hydratase